MAAGVKVTHPDKVLYPDAGVTKRDLVVYCARVSSWLVPELAERPLVRVRCPQGVDGTCFYHKKADDSLPDYVRRVRITEGGETVTYPEVHSVEGLIYMVQLDTLELHTWNCRRDDIERPDRFVIDLDPCPGVEWERTMAAARLVRERLDDLGLGAFLKTTGGKGLHVVTPLVRRDGWDEVKRFARALAISIERTSPGEFTTNVRKVRREGKIFVDYIRNARGATTVAAYSPRARPGALVSVPIYWDELTSELRPDFCTVRNLPERLESLEVDPWEDYEDARRPLTKRMWARLPPD